LGKNESQNQLSNITSLPSSIFLQVTLVLILIMLLWAIFQRMKIVQ
jgi:hypothetical protein